MTRPRVPWKRVPTPPRWFPDFPGWSSSEDKSRTAALWAIATALAVIAALLALIVMINANG